MKAMHSSHNVTPLLTGLGVLIGLFLSMILFFFSPQTPIWIYLVNILLLAVIGFLVGRYQHSRISEYSAMQDKLIASNRELESLVAENKVVIENQQETEDKISTAKRTWEAIFDAVDDPIILVDQENKVIRCNLATINVLKTSFKDILGKNFNTIFKSVDGLTLTIGRDVQFTNIPGWFTISPFPIELDESLPGTIYIIHDISEQQAANSEILQQKEYFEALVKNSPVAIVIMDMDSNILACNPAFEKLYGYQQEEVRERIRPVDHPGGRPGSRNPFLQPGCPWINHP